MPTITPQIERFVLLSGLDHPLYRSANPHRLSGTEEFILVDRMLDPNGTELFDRYAHRVLLSDNQWHNPQECSRTVDWLATWVERRLPRRTVIAHPLWIKTF